MTTVSRTTTQGKDQEVLNGIHKELQSMQTMHLGSETYTPQTLADFIQSRIAQAGDARPQGARRPRCTLTGSSVAAR